MFLAIVPLANAQSVEEKGAGLRRLSRRERHSGRHVIADDLGAAPNYLYVQLRDFNGLRKSEVMEPLTRALQRDEMMAIALYFSKLTWPGLHQPRIETPVAARALQTNASVGCTGGHMAGYQGQGVFPRLAGQSVTYLVKAMTDFRISSRSTHPVMMEFMNATSEDDLKAMAVYLTGL
jgi:cytochrome c553